MKVFILLQKLVLQQFSSLQLLELTIVQLGQLADLDPEIIDFGLESFNQLLLLLFPLIESFGLAELVIRFLVKHSDVDSQFLDVELQGVFLLLRNSLLFLAREYIRSLQGESLGGFLVQKGERSLGFKSYFPTPTSVLLFHTLWFQVLWFKTLLSQTLLFQALHFLLKFLHVEL